MENKRNEISKIPLLAIIGPTASNKSAIANECATLLRGEIVNADSRQIYKYCFIGTSSPSSLTKRDIPHHLYNFLEPPIRFSAAEYAKTASQTLIDLNKNGIFSVVVGGSGLYLRALIEGLFKAPGQNLQLRATLKKIAALMGSDFLHKQLFAIDPPSAHTILKNDLFRIIRAIEIFYLTGMPKSHLIQEQAPNTLFNVLKIGVEVPRSLLYYTIDKRVDTMIASGLIEEVRYLMEHYDPDSPILHSIGYKELIPYLKGSTTATEAICLIKRNTKRYAKRQLTWFKKDKNITWKTSEECLNPTFIALIKNYFSLQ